MERGEQKNTVTNDVDRSVRDPNAGLCQSLAGEDLPAELPRSINAVLMLASGNGHVIELLGDIFSQSAHSLPTVRTCAATAHLDHPA